MLNPGIHSIRTTNRIWLLSQKLEGSALGMPEVVLAKALVAAVRRAVDAHPMIRSEQHCGTFHSRFLEFSYWLNLLRCADVEFGKGVVHVKFSTAGRRLQISSFFLCLPLSLALLISVGCRPCTASGPRHLIRGSFIVAPTEEDADEYRSAAETIVNQGKESDLRGPRKFRDFGLWGNESHVPQGIPFSIGALPATALAGIDKSMDGHSPCPTAWQTLCTASSARFLRHKSGRLGATLPDMIQQPVSYGDWQACGIVTRRTEEEAAQLGATLHDV